MRYIEVREPGRLTLLSGSVPTPGLEQVVVAVEYCGLCRSDVGAAMEFNRGGPFRLGHEAAGRVSEVGPGSAYSKGDIVVAYVDGGYATEVLASDKDLIRVPSGLGTDVAFLGEPLACALLVVDRLRLTGAPSVAMVGSGFMGLLVLMQLARRGLSVVVIDPREAARRAAAAFGAASVYETADSLPDNDVFDVVLECSGTPQGLDTASSLAVTGGQLAILGYHQSGKGLRTVSIQSWNRKGLDVVNAHEPSPARTIAAIGRALRILALFGDAYRPLVTQTIALEEFADAFPSIVSDQKNIKGVVKC